MWSVVVPVVLATLMLFAVTRFRAASRKLDELLAEIDEPDPSTGEGRSPRQEH